MEWEYQTLKEFAEENNIQPATLRQRIKRGALEAKKIGNTWIVKKDQKIIDHRRKENKK